MQGSKWLAVCKLLRAQQAKEDAVRSLLVSISHELRTPAQSGLAAAALLARLPCAAERLAFTYASGCTFAILHLQINLSHWSQRVLPGAPPGGWVDTQLAATLNWSCPPWLDWCAAQHATAGW